MQYKHLGSVASHNCGFNAEIAARCNRALAAHMALKSRVFCNLRFSLKARLHAYDACVESVLFLSAGGWPQLSTQQAAKLEDRLYKTATSKVGLSAPTRQAGLPHTIIRPTLSH